MNIDHINERYHGDLTDPATERARRRVHWICGQAAGQEILDVGCSQGIVCLILGREGFRCTGVDIEAGSLAIAQEALTKEGQIVQKRVAFRIADASQLPFEDESFDTVVLGEILEHLTHPQKALSEAKRVLRDGGRVVVTVPHGLNAFHDHKQSYYPLSLLDLLQPVFRTCSMDTSSHYILYTGLKERNYRPDTLSKEALFDEYLRLERMVEARCLEKEQELLETATKLYAQIKTLTTQTANDQNRVQELMEAGAAGDKRAHELETKLEESSLAAAALREEISRAEAERAAKDASFARTRLEAASSTAALAAVQSQLTALTAENAALRNGLLAKEQDALHRRADAEKVAAALASAQQRLKASETESAALRQELSAKDATLARAHLEAASSASALTAVQSQLTALTAENAALRNGLLAKEQDALHRRADAEKVAAALASAQQRLKASEAESAALRQELSAKDATLARARAEVSASSATLAAAQREGQSLRAEAADLRQELTAQHADWQHRFTEQEKLHMARLREQERQLPQGAAAREAEWTRRAANQRVRDVVRAALPADARVLVISKGDDDLLQLDGRHGWHFPQTSAGVYAGYHPANSSDAIAHLEALKAKGAEFLLIPAASFWWLDYYAEFRCHLESRYCLITYAEQTCLVFALRPLPAEPTQRLTLSFAGAATPKASAGDETQPASKPATPTMPAVSAVAVTAARRKPSSDRLTIAGILDEFTAACFAPECSLVTFRPDNWKSVLEGTPVDLLFVESAWHGNGGSWQYKIASFQKPMGEELVDVVNYCKARQIPTVFWNKEDPPHFHRFIHRAQMFDVVFTSDADMIPRYRAAVKHEKVFALPFAAQPKIHHPILEANRLHDVCFAGAYYAADHDERRRDMDLLLRPALAFGLHIYDRQHGLAGAQAKLYQFPEIYQPAIQGRLEYDAMVRAYKWYRVFLNVNSVKQSPTMFSRRVFELLASGTPVISAYAKGIVELLGKDIVQLTTSEEETQAHLEGLLKDEGHWARISVRGIREVLSRHTYAHRLAEICRNVGLPFAGIRLPSIRAVARIDATDQIKPLVETLVRQVYRHFSLLVLTGDRIPKRELDTLSSALPDIKIEVQPAAGRGLEALSRTSDGDYLWRVHGEDYYGDCFLQDAALATLYADADVIGKHTHFAVGVDGRSVRLTQPGHESRWTNRFCPGSVIAKAGRLSPDQWEALAAKRSFVLPDRRGVSLDRFNYVRRGGALGKARGKGHPGWLAEVAV